MKNLMTGLILLLILNACTSAPNTDATAIANDKATMAAMATAIAAEKDAPQPADTPAPHVEVELAPDTPPPPADPALGGLTFATTVTADMQPADPADTFAAGITEIHAVFSHQNIPPGESWERVWYLDNEEVLRSAEPWSGDRDGMFDYFLDADGQSLPPGEWELEIYLRGELALSGGFIIETPIAAATATRIPTATRRPTATRAPTGTPTPKPVAGGGSGGGVYQLAYSRWDGGFHNLYIGDTNGNNERLIIKRAAGPSWSPNGKQLFFFGEQGINQQYAPDGRVDCEFNTISGGIVALDIPPGEGDICTVHYGPWLCERKSVDVNSPPSDVCEEGGLKVFQNLDWKEGSARWANVAGDGSSVAYDARPGGGYRIYFRSILNNAQYHFEIIGEQADWSPDSQRLVYRSGRDNVQGLWISNRDDTGHVNITVNGTDAFPAWSPNGRLIAFVRDSGGGNQDIYTMNADGNNIQRLTDAPGHDILPVFTPSGDIIFRSDRTGSWGIWKMSGSGGGQREIIAKAAVGPDWTMSRMDVR